MSRRGGNLWLTAGLLMALWVLLATASYFLLTLPRQRCFDFYPRWVGARAVLSKENPYTQTVTWRIQEGMFARRLEPTEDQQRFAYPATITWLLLPFWFLPFPLAVSLWCGLLLLLLLTFPLFLMSLLRWRPDVLSLLVMLLFSVLIYRYPINAYLLGQFTPFCLACLIGAWWGLARGHTVWATLALLCATVRPEVTLLPLLVLLAAAWREGHQRVVVAWMGVMGLLWLLTRLWIGPWVGDFLAGLRAYAEYSYPRWPPLAVGTLWLAVLVSAGVGAWGVWMWSQIYGLPLEVWMPWGIGVATLVGLIILPQTNTYTLVLGLLPAWVTLWAGGERWRDRLPVLAILASAWIFHLARCCLPLGLEQLLIPLALGALLTHRWHAWRCASGLQCLYGARAATGLVERP